MTISEGDAAPSFDLHADGGVSVSSESLGGRAYVLYFYPKDDTPGCTKEAIGFTEAYPEFQRLGVEVVGVSKDTVNSHEKFKQKHGLCFPLASDEAGSVVEAYGAWVEKSMYGRKYMGMERSSFLVGVDGKIAKVYPEVSPETHADEILEVAASL